MQTRLGYCTTALGVFCDVLGYWRFGPLSLQEVQKCIRNIPIDGGGKKPAAAQRLKAHPILVWDV